MQVFLGQTVPAAAAINDTPDISSPGFLRCQAMCHSGSVPLQYIAPEVLEDQPQSKAADIFSLGMVMWEVCTRQEPYGHLQPWHASKQAVLQKR